jgi:hypothetical protein
VRATNATISAIALRCRVAFRSESGFYYEAGVAKVLGKKEGWFSDADRDAVITGLIIQPDGGTPRMHAAEYDFVLPR